MATIVQYNLIDPTIATAVAQDHQSRQATYRVTYDDGTTGTVDQMLFWNGANVRSVPLTDWPAAAQGEIQAGVDADALRQRVRTVAQSAVGVQFDQLTAVQLRALVAILLWREGALDNTGAVRPLVDWVK